MKRNILVVLLVATIVFAITGCGSKPVPKDEAIIGEWKYDAEKNNTVDTTSNFMFYENGNFKWLVSNPEVGGNILLEGYFIPADTLSLIVGTDQPVEFEYSISADSLKFDGLYYKKSKDLDFTPSAQINTPTTTTQAAAPTPVSIDLSAGKYTVGTDVPPGKYDITAISGTGNFFGRPSIVSEMMGVDNNHYIPSYKNATFQNGDEIEIAGDLVVNLTSK